MCRYQQKVPQHDYLLDTPVVDVRRIGLTFSLKNLRTFGSRKPRPNDSNILTQHVPTLLAQYLQGPVKQSQQLNGTDRNIFGRDTLHTFGHPVATCCELKNGTSAHAHAQHCCTNLAKWLQHHATSTNVAFMNIWPFSNLSQHVATHCNMVVKRTQHVAPNNVAICCVEILRSFGRGFMFTIFTIMLIHNAQNILLFFKDALLCCNMLTSRNSGNYIEALGMLQWNCFSRVVFAQ